MSSFARSPAEYRLTFRDWLSMPDSVRLQELIGGEIYVSPTPSVQHQRVSRRIARALEDHVVAHGGGEVFYAPLGVRLSDEDVPEPDVLVVLPGGRARVADEVIEGPPDLIVEVLSPGTAGRDLVEKRALYEASGVREYWIVDVKRERIEVLALREGRYGLAGAHGRGDTLRSPLLAGLALDVTSVFTRP